MFSSTLSHKELIKKASPVIHMYRIIIVAI